ncbi:MAG: hypothetical protein D6790_11275, partial [Caldilineae bacterium]
LFLAPRLHAAWVIAARASRSAFFGLGFYLTAAVALLLATTLVLNNLAFADENTLIVMVRPLYLPVFLAAVLVSLYLSLNATLSVARERDRGTLRVLLFGPVDAVSYLGGRLLGQLILFAAFAGLAVVWAGGLAALSNMNVHVDLLAVLVLGLVANAAIVSFGLLAAGWGRTSRAALVLFVVIVLLALVFQFGDQIILQLANRVQPNRQDPILFLRQVLAGANYLLLWLSPYAQMARAMDALVVGSLSSVFAHLAAMLGQMIVYFAGAVYALQRSEL